MNALPRLKSFNLYTGVLKGGKQAGWINKKSCKNGERN